MLKTLTMIDPVTYEVELNPGEKYGFTLDTPIKNFSDKPEEQQVLKNVIFRSRRYKRISE